MSAQGLDELHRAAEAAGFAMAAPDDDDGATERAVPVRKVSVEEVARGGLRGQPADRQLLLAAPRTQPNAAPSRLIAGAHSVRETVYGYLGFGVPA